MSETGKHVLLIDDDPDMHDTVRLILGSNGYRVTCYATGPAGMQAIRQSPPDVVLLDIMLSSPTEGFELAAALRRDEALRAIPIILVSSLDEQAGADFAREAGVAAAKVERFIEKPLNAKVLLAALEVVFDGQRG